MATFDGRLRQLMKEKKRLMYLNQVSTLIIMGLLHQD